jgi:D-sedoheptulose 7-phosphate isomerase
VNESMGQQMPVDALAEVIHSYLRELQDLLSRLPTEAIGEAVQMLHDARLARRRVYTLGNGGSSATAAHFANDLNKLANVAGQPRFQAFCLADNTPLFSAWANDGGYENAFAEQLVNFASPGDVVIAISGSGNSPNVLRAVEMARSLGARTIGLAGFDGGRLSELVDCCILVPCHSMPRVEDAHMALEHCISCALRDLAGDLEVQAL